MGCSQLKHLPHGDNAKYTSRRVTHEFLQVMSDMIEQAQLRDLLASPVYSLLIDETTDIAIVKEMVIYARFINSDTQAQTVFLKITELTNGRAETIEEALMTYLDKCSIPLSHLVGFGSDEASVMTGKHSGVAARIKAKQPILTSTHCIAHRLALAAGQAGDKVKFIADTFKPTLKQLFYFYENSPIRLNGLKAIEELLQTPELKLKKPLDTCWLSHDAACQTLKKVLPAVIASLEREVEERGEALAVGLSKVVQKYNFIATLYMMCDALPKVYRLSRLFQLSNIDLAELHSHVQTTVNGLNGLNSHSGENFSQLDSDLASTLAPYNIPHSPEATSRFFFYHIQKPFLHALVENIKERLPDTDVFTNFEIFNPLKLTHTVEDMCSEKYGEMQVDKLGEKYGLGDSPIISCDDLKLEWLDFRIYMLSARRQ